MNLRDLIADLEEERQWVERLVSVLDDSSWDRPTPAEGWTVKDQIWHLAYFDGAAAQALEEPERFREHVATADSDIDAYLAGVEEEGRRLSGARTLQTWKSSRERFNAAVLAARQDVRAPWYGVEMSTTTMVTARLMETWAHGVDVADALDSPIAESERLSHVVFLGWRAMPFSFSSRGLRPPDGGIRVEVTTPGGTLVELGPVESSGRVTGPALDLALVVTQRRHWRDTALHLEGTARDWIEVAQAFAGPPGPGRQPRTS